MPSTIHLPLLQSARIASPCPARWEDMRGDNRTRRCEQCNLDVHNIADLTAAEAEQLLARSLAGRVCAQIYRRRDGTLLTRDCPTGLAIARAKLLKATARIAAAIGLAVLSAAAAQAAQDKAWGNWGWAVRLRSTTAVRYIHWRIQFGWKYPFASSRFGAIRGEIACPPQSPPPIPPPAGAIGPHPMEYRQ